jgi:hypothetical protein
MIANDQEFAVVSRQLLELKLRRAQLLRDGAADGFQLHIEVTGVEKMIARLQEEIDAFENQTARTLVVGKNSASVCK